MDQSQLQGQYILAVAQPGTKQLQQANVKYLQDANIFENNWYLTQAFP